MKWARFVDSDQTFVATSDDGKSWGARGRTVDLSRVRWAPAVNGDVVGVALSDREALVELANVFQRPPFGTPPRQPVFYVKSHNTLCGHGDTVELPHGVDALEIGGTVGLIFSGRDGHMLEAQTFELVGGYTIAIDLTLPGGTYFRPPIREKCFDRACPIGPWVVESSDVYRLEGLEVTTRVNGKLVARRSLGDSLDSVRRAISAASEFMTFRTGDVLLAGIPYRLPIGRAGDIIEVEVSEIGRLAVTLAEVAP
jgi:5-oxopent-3-ene-1,2,5-tricarboxylate decarboxylase/2-hydroxyhepta-2,4-diene-1,7-dioate isomerase